MTRNVGRDELLVAALGSGSSYSQAAQTAGCSVATVSRRLRDPGFRERVAEARTDYVEGLRARLVSAAPAAVDALIELLAADGAVRFGAARALLDHGLGRPRRGFEFDPIRPAQVRRFVYAFVEVALEYLPEERHEVFLRRAEAVCRSA